MTKKSKIILSTCFILCAVVLIAGLSLAFILNYNKLSPEPVVIEQTSSNVYVRSESNNNFFGYRFKFKDGKNEIVMNCEEPLLDITNSTEFSAGITYDVSVCFLGESEGGNSEYSKPVQYKCIKFLSSPVIKYENNKLTWGKIKNADYYKLNCWGDKFTEVIIYDLGYDISKLPTGALKINVQAISSTENFIASFNSNTLTINNIRLLKSFVSARFDESKLELNVTGLELLTKIDVKIGETIYQFTQFDVTHHLNAYIYTLDLRVIFTQGSTISVAPSSIDNFNIYNGGFTTII